MVTTNSFGWIVQAVGVFVGRSHAEARVTPAEIRAYVKKHVGGQSAPTWVWFLGEEGVSTEFPKTASGKIQKVRLTKRSGTNWLGRDSGPQCNTDIKTALFRFVLGQSLAEL